MTIFLIVAALLLAAALLFVLPPLLRKTAVVRPHALRAEVNLTVLRDQLRELDADLAAGTITASAHESARQELERRVVEDVQPGLPGNDAPADKRWAAIAVGLSLPVLAIAMYFVLGSPAGLDPQQTAAPQVQEQAHAVTEEQIVNMVATLAQRLENNPGDIEGWNMLARSYSALGRFDQAAEAYARLVKLAPDNANTLADYADTLAMTLNKSLQGEPEKLVLRALAVDPNNIKALALSGSAAFERRDYQGAVTQWRKILPLVPPESDFVRSISASISEAQGLASAQGGLPATAAPVSAAPVSAAPVATPPAVAGAQVAGTVELDPALSSKVAATDTVFIFVRAAQGPPFPLAVLRKQVKDLPATFVLNDSMSMVPDTKLSDFALVVVGARISKSGNAIPSSGDFEGVTEPVRPGTKGLKIRIHTQRP